MVAKVSCVAKYSGMCTVNTIPQVAYEIFMYIQICFLVEGKHNKQSNPAAQKTKALGKEKSKMKKIIISLDVQDPEVTRIGKVEMANCHLDSDYHHKCKLDISLRPRHSYIKLSLCALWGTKIKPDFLFGHF